MRLVTFSDAQGARIGVDDPASGTLVDLSVGTRLPREMTAFIALGKSGLARARRAVRSGEGRLPAAGVGILAPIPRPSMPIMAPTTPTPPVSAEAKVFEQAYKDFREAWIDAGEKEYVRRLLLRHDRNVAAAAREADVDRTYIYRLIRKHDL